MTCIVAFKTEEGHSVIAGDYMASNGHNFHKVANSKVFSKSDKCAVGYTSSFRMGQILEHYWTLPPRTEGQELENYINVTVIESLRATFKTYGYGMKNGLEDLGGNFLLLYGERIYEVQYNYSVLDYDLEVIAVGSGSDAAQAALYCLLPVKLENVEEMLMKVFEATSMVTATVSPEFSYIVIGDPDLPTKEASTELTEEEQKEIAETFQEKIKDAKLTID